MTPPSPKPSLPHNHPSMPTSQGVSDKSLARGVGKQKCKIPLQRCPQRVSKPPLHREIHGKMNTRKMCGKMTPAGMHGSLKIREVPPNLKIGGNHGQTTPEAMFGNPKVVKIPGQVTTISGVGKANRSTPHVKTNLAKEKVAVVAILVGETCTPKIQPQIKHKTPTLVVERVSTVSLPPSPHVGEHHNRIMPRGAKG